MALRWCSKVRWRYWQTTAPVPVPGRRSTRPRPGWPARKSRNATSCTGLYAFLSLAAIPAVSADNMGVGAELHKGLGGRQPPTTSSFASSSRRGCHVPDRRLTVDQPHRCRDWCQPARTDGPHGTQHHPCRPHLPSRTAERDHLIAAAMSPLAEARLGALLSCCRERLTRQMTDGTSTTRPRCQDGVLPGPGGPSG